MEYGGDTLKRVQTSLAWGEHFPLTDAQAEKWLGSRYSTQASLAFNEAFELRFDGAVEDQRLIDAFQQVIARHEAFAVRIDGNGCAQVFEPPSTLHLEYADLSCEADPETAYAAYCRQQSALAIDPAVGPLARARLCRLSDADVRVYMLAHHLLLDGWSLRIFLQECVAFYNASRSGRPLRLPAADSWSNYARTERMRRDGAEGRRSLEYWVRQLNDRPEPLSLPTDYPRSANIGFAAANLCMGVEPALWQRLRVVSREQKVTRFTMLLTAYALLLHRLTGQTDLLIGIPFAGAARGAGARMIGDTDNTLPLRIRIDPKVPIAGLLQQVQHALREASDYQDVSLGRIVDALHLPRNTGRLLLVDSILTLEPAMDGLKFDGTNCRIDAMPRIASAWELALHWRQTPASLVLEIQYQTALYAESTVRAWCNAYLDLLDAIAKDASANPDSLAVDVMPGAFSLVEDGSLAPLDEASLSDLLRESFINNAGRSAAQCGNSSLSYAGLDADSRKLASALLARGIGAGNKVGVYMARSLDMLVAVLGIMRAGAAYVPLDPAFPQDRLTFMAADAALGCLLVSDESSVPVAISEGRMLLSVSSMIDEAHATLELPVVAADGLAYVLYTSGSTGLPKGVCISHRNLVNFLRSMRVEPGFSHDDVICSATTLSFDIVALELYLPLLCGGRVVIADDNEHRDPEALCRLIEGSGCTVLQTTPSLLALLQEVGRAHVLKPLRLFVGGEAMPLALARSLVAGCRELWNMYGPTETTVWSAISRINADDAVVPLGRPIANTKLYLLDNLQRPAFPGARGEIWIGGAGVAAGYLDRIELTSERFVCDPFANDGSRMYRTGDLGRIHAGNLYFHGRADAQIKLRGYRIEPGEIEAAATGEPGVLECVAVAREAGSGDQLLVLYVVADGAQDHLEARIRARLTLHLPGYMRPQHIVLLRSMPKTPNGKVDRKSLPPPFASPLVTVDSVAPRDPLEAELLAQWQRLLQRDGMGVHDNFFDMGGYSLLAVRMFAELHEQHGVEFPLATLIEHPTIAELANVLRASAVLPAQAHVQSTGPALPVRGSGVLVKLKSGDGSPPLFLMHAVGGNVLNYLPLANRLAAGQAVYGLQSVGLDGAAAPLNCIDDMAEYYADEIRQVQPHGPYLLGGGSMGGILALEVARRLEGAGRSIVMLAMFDTYGPEDPRTVAKPLWWRPQCWWPLYRQLDHSQKLELLGRIRFRVLQLPWARLKQYIQGGAAIAPALRIWQVERSNLEALVRYQPRAYGGGLIMFRTRMKGGSDDPGLGWKAWIGQGMQIVELDGRHDNFVGQPELAVRLQECMDRALAK